MESNSTNKRDVNFNPNLKNDIKLMINFCIENKINPKKAPDLTKKLFWENYESAMLYLESLNLIVYKKCSTAIEMNRRFVRDKLVSNNVNDLHIEQIMIEAEACNFDLLKIYKYVEFLGYDIRD